MRGYGACCYYLFWFSLYIVYIAVGYYFGYTTYDETGCTFEEVARKHGWVVAYVLSATTFPMYFAVVLSVVNLMGIFLFNPFSTRTVGNLAAKETPFYCFRVVTRGMFPKLVQEVTDSNVQTVLSLGIQNFKFEVVTDNVLNLTSSHYVREVVVPRDYRTPNQTMFKARALNYCLIPTVSILSPEDWIIHLDEETRLTESVLHGIVDFTRRPGSQIGQGVITYGETGIENIITTLMDGLRTAFDFGMFRIAHQGLHRPIFGFKGSFIVVKMSVEADIGFDFGPAECIAEDLRFALTAWDRGYKFDFVEGTMQEKSTFSLSDYIKQRKRWFIGHYHILWGNTIPLYCKFALLPMHVCNMLMWLNFLFLFVEIPFVRWQATLRAMLTANFLFMLMFGNYISLCQSSYNVFTKLVLCLLSQLVMPINGVLEASAAVVGFYNRNRITFDIVQKETKIKPFIARKIKRILDV